MEQQPRLVDELRRKRKGMTERNLHALAWWIQESERRQAAGDDPLTPETATELWNAWMFGAPDVTPLIVDGEELPHNLTWKADQFVFKRAMERAEIRSRPRT